MPSTSVSITRVSKTEGVICEEGLTHVAEHIQRVDLDARQTLLGEQRPPLRLARVRVREDLHHFHALLLRYGLEDHVLDWRGRYMSTRDN